MEDLLEEDIPDVPVIPISCIDHNVQDMVEDDDIPSEESLSNVMDMLSSATLEDEQKAVMVAQQEYPDYELEDATVNDVEEGGVGSCEMVPPAVEGVPDSTVPCSIRLSSQFVRSSCHSSHRGQPTPCDVREAKLRCESSDCSASSKSLSNSTPSRAQNHNVLDAHSAECDGFSSTLHSNTTSTSIHLSLCTPNNIVCSHHSGMLNGAESRRTDCIQKHCEIAASLSEQNIACDCTTSTNEHREAGHVMDNGCSSTNEHRGTGHVINNGSSSTNGTGHVMNGDSGTCDVRSPSYCRDHPGIT